MGAQARACAELFSGATSLIPSRTSPLAQTSSLITREKENLGRTRSRGVEIDGVVHVNRDIQISAGYEFTAATVVSYPSPPVIPLVGLDVAQVPRNVFTWEARYWNPSRLLFSVQGRFVGRAIRRRPEPASSGSLLHHGPASWSRPHIGTSNCLPLPKICSTSVTRWRARPSSIWDRRSSTGWDFV